jgi:hypothetical protein
MAKGVANLYRYAEISFAANSRYLDALATVGDPAKVQQHLKDLGRRVQCNGRTYRGFIPIAKLDLQLFLSVLKGEHAIMGFRNRDVRLGLFANSKDPIFRRRQSSRVSRLLKLLHVHKLIAKMPRSRRWRVTSIGHAIMPMFIELHQRSYSKLLVNQTG